MSQYLLYREKYLDIKGGSFFSGITDYIDGTTKTNNLLQKEVLTVNEAKYLENNTSFKNNFMKKNDNTYIKINDFATEEIKKSVNDVIFTEYYTRNHNKTEPLYTSIKYTNKLKRKKALTDDELN